ncbi:MAG: GGDEF domain-containing protein, partial [Clostridia bacterium]|nr:GGDEF domain-containing protein [Clostridia bacterium]
MIRYDFSFFLLVISTLLVSALFYFIMRIKNKSQIHYAFIFMISTIFIWSIGHILEILTTNIYGYTIMIYVYIYYLGLCLAPIAILFIGIIFTKTKISFKLFYLLLFVFPLIDYFIIVTNSYHHLFFIEYSIFNEFAVVGKYFIYHTIISYIYILVGLYYLVSFTIKNSGFFSKQSLLIIIGVLIPLSLNIFISFGVIT